MKLPIKLQIPNDFFNDEVRCEFMVEKRVKKVWAIQLDLLNEFIRVCDKHHLNWFVGFGTMLGAVRHKGYIPWDNDIDIVMPREDYENLLEIGEQEFQHPYFFQNPKTEHGRFFFFFSRLSNSLTTGASPEHWSSRMNCGIYMDIYPLDYIPDNRWAVNCYINKLHNIQYLSRFCGTFYRSEKKGVVQKAKMFVHYVHYRLLGSPNAAQLFGRFNKCASVYKGRSNRVGCLILGYNPKWTWNAIDWNEYEVLNFEMLQVRVPNGYHNILAQAYGDYMQFPKDKTTHDFISFDSETPYYEYFAKNGYAYK